MPDNLKKIIELAKADGGKFFVIDEHGNPVLVIMGVAEYEKVLLKKMQNQIEDIEEVNKKIAEAQTEIEREAQIKQQRFEQQEQLRSEIIDSTFDFESPQQPQQLDDL